MQTAIATGFTCEAKWEDELPFIKSFVYVFGFEIGTNHSKMKRYLAGKE